MKFIESIFKYHLLSPIGATILYCTGGFKGAVLILLLWIGNLIIDLIKKE